MMGEYYVNGQDVLENKLGIKDKTLLYEAESDIVYARMIELFLEPVEGEFNFDMLKKIHHRLFSDIYTMAGLVRTVRIAKSGSVFCYPENIQEEQLRIFSQLENENWLRGLERQNFLNRFAYFSSELNALHPFREGNGRAIKVFLKQLAEAAGWEIFYDDINSEELMEAEIQAFRGDLKPLIDLLQNYIE